MTLKFTTTQLGMIQTQAEREGFPAAVRRAYKVIHGITVPEGPDHDFHFRQRAHQNFINSDGSFYDDTVVVRAWILAMEPAGCHVVFPHVEDSHLLKR
jgi:hypothetical protein